jgi:hypothetical protein
MRLALITWLAFALTASAQMTGFGGGTGGGSGGGFGGGSGSSSGGFSGGSGSSNSTSMAITGITAQTLIGSFSTTTSSRTNTAISLSNPFNSYYLNPYAQGLVSGTGTSVSSVASFGQAIYSSTNLGGSGSNRTGSAGGTLGSTVGSSTGSRTTGTGSTSTGFGTTGSTTGLLGGGSSTLGALGGGSQNAMGRAPGSTGFGPGGTATPGSTNTGLANRGAQPSVSTAAPAGLKSGILYSTNIGFPVAVVPANQFQTRLSQVITRSTSFAVPGNIRVDFNSGLVVLRGTVANQQEAIRAENLMRLEPGVRDVKNELQIRE